MNPKKNTGGRKWAALASLLTLVGVCCAPAQAPNYSLSGPTACLSNAWQCLGVAGAVPAVCTNPIAVPIKLGAGLGILANYWTGVDTSTYPMTINWSVSPDNVMWTAGSTFSTTFLARGKTNTYSFTNIPSFALDNVRFVKPYSITVGTTTNAFCISNLYILYKY